MPNPWLNEHKSTAAIIYFLNLKGVQQHQNRNQNLQVK
jgi:hypothetical protein